MHCIHLSEHYHKLPLANTRLKAAVAVITYVSPTINKYQPGVGAINRFTSNVAKSHPNMASLLTEEKQTINSLIRGERSIQKKRRTRETVKYALTGEDFPNVDDIVLVKVLHPLYVCLGIFGMIWKGKQKLFHRKICSFDLCTLHCVILLGMSWCHAFQFFASYEKSDVFGSVLFQKIGIHVFSFQMACGLTSFVFFHYKHIPNFIKLWENYKIRYGGVLPISVKKTLAVRCIWINIFTIGFIAFVKGYMFIKDKRLFARHNLPLLAYILDEPELWLLVLCGILNFYLTMAWIQSLISILCITKALHDEFLQLSLDLRERLHEGNSQSHKFQIWKPAGKNNKYQIEMYRQRHLQLCKLVQVYDDSASCYLLFLYLFSIPVLVLIMYILWGLDKESYTEDLNQFVLSIVSLVFFVVILISVTVAVTSLNTAVSTAFSNKFDIHKRSTLKTSI